MYLTISIFLDPCFKTVGVQENLLTRPWVCTDGKCPTRIITPTSVTLVVPVFFLAIALLALGPWHVPDEVKPELGDIKIYPAAPAELLASLPLGRNLLGRVDPPTWLGPAQLQPHGLAGRAHLRGDGPVGPTRLFQLANGLRLP